MKWCFLVNRAPFIAELFGAFASELEKQGDEYIIVFNDKISEWTKKKHFPEGSRCFSQPDWCIENYQKEVNPPRDFDWKYFFGDFDRFFRYKVYNFNYQNSRKIVNQTYQFAEHIFQEEKPDMVLAEPPTCIFNEAFSFLAKKNNSNYFGLMESRIPNRFDLYDKEYTFSGYEKAFEQLELSEKDKVLADNFIRDFISHEKVPSYMDFQVEVKKMGERKRLLRYLKKERGMFPYYLKYISQRKKYKNFDAQTEMLIKYVFKHLRKAIKSRIRKIFQRKIFDRIDKKDEYYLFPLQLQPEASTATNATYFSDQINSIKNIAFTLPFPQKLYVKEHPSAVGTQPNIFYRKIKEIPNVVLVDYGENVLDLIKDSQGVITLTSTVGMEAMFSGKPVYILGDVFYEYHPLCYKVSSFENLRQKLKEKRLPIDNLTEINRRFFISYYKNTILGSIITTIFEDDTNNYQQICNNIKECYSRESFR